MSEYIDFIAIAHGTLGVLILMGIGGVIASLWGEPKKSVRGLKFFSTLAAVSAFLIVLFGDALYLFYRSPDNARSLINAGSTPWAHGIVMEFKEHAGHFVPVLLLISLTVVLHYREEMLSNKQARISVLLFVLASLFLTLVEMAMGAFITGVQPVI